MAGRVPAARPCIEPKGLARSRRGALCRGPWLYPKRTGQVDDRRPRGDRPCGRRAVLDASTELLTALLAPRRQPAIEDAFEQALTIVYRIVFLLFAEARNLVPLWHPIYRESYSLDALCHIAERAPAAVGLWDAL